MAYTKPFAKLPVALLLPNKAEFSHFYTVAVRCGCWLFPDPDSTTGLMCTLIGPRDSIRLTVLKLRLKSMELNLKNYDNEASVYYFRPFVKSTEVLIYEDFKSFILSQFNYEHKIAI
jgi:hypothetical protein